MPESLSRLPRAELHVHLDGSLRAETMLELAAAANVKPPADTTDALRRYMLVDDARDLEQYLSRFDHTIALLQTEDAVERVAYEMVEDASRDNVRYLEVRYCPRLSTRGGLTMDQVIEAEWRGLQRGEREFGTIARIINCSLRHYDPAVSVAIAEHSLRMRDHGVVGFDLAGGEAGRPCEQHRAAFELAARGGLGITVHAGEAAGWESIFEAVHSCHAMRIGHGTRLFENPAFMHYIRDRQLCLEINITSNVQTHAVSRAEDHPVRDYFAAGIPVVLCTDSWLMSGVESSDEYRLARNALGFADAELSQVARSGFEHAFLPLPQRQALLDAVLPEIAAFAA